MKYSMLIAMMLCLWVTTSRAEMGVDQRYERDYNIFNPANGAIPETAAGFLRWRRSRYSSTKPAVHTKGGMDAPRNPANAYDPDSAFNPANRYDAGNSANPVNKYSPKMVRQTVDRLVGRFTIGDLQRACPGVSYPTLQRVLTDLKKERKVRCLGRGPDTQWERITRKQG